MLAPTSFAKYASLAFMPSLPKIDLPNRERKMEWVNEGEVMSRKGEVWGRRGKNEREGVCSRKVGSEERQDPIFYC